MTIWTFGLTLFGALTMSWLAERLRLPTVVGQIGAGIILGPAGFHLLSANHSLATWAEVGVLLLMFLAGIESDLGLLKRHARQAVTVALAGVVTPFVVFLVLGLALGMTDEKSLFWSVLFSATSVSITAQILTEYHQVKSDAGATILGAAVLDDILAILMWTVYQTVFGIGEETQRLLWFTILLMVMFLLVLVAILLYVLPKILPAIGRLSLPGAVLTFALVIVLLSATLSEKIGLSGAIVAFVVGVLFSRQKSAAAIEHGVTLIGQTVFIPIFFVNIGLKVTLVGQLANLPLIALLTVFAILTKFFGAYFGARLVKVPVRDARVVGVGMVSRGEMAIVIADLALSAHALSSGHYAMLTLVILLTTIFTPIALKSVLRK